jgi:hypothetical protein
VTIAKGKPWGTPGALPPGGLVVHSDAEAGAQVERALADGRGAPVLGLLGGDLCRSLGGGADAGRLHSETALTFPVDLGVVTVEGSTRRFVAHVVARTRFWTSAFVAMNSPWLGDWNLAPRAHPNDGVLDAYEWRMTPGDFRKVRRRLHLGSHLPHPAIREQRARRLEVALPKRLGLWVDGVDVGTAQEIVVEVVPDALTVIV